MFGDTGALHGSGDGVIDDTPATKKDPRNPRKRHLNRYETQTVISTTTHEGCLVTLVFYMVLDMEV